MKNILCKNQFIQINLNLKHFFRIMRIFCFLITFCIATAFATTVNSQNVKVTLSTNSLTIRQLISQIERQTNYLFVYNSDKINLDKSIKVNDRRASLGQILNDAFDNEGIAYRIEGSNIILVKKNMEVLSTTNVQQQKNVVKGRVVDEKGEPIIGASVAEKGSSTGTITDTNGDFSIAVPKNSTLVISYIGYSTLQVAVGGRSNVKVTMTENTKALDEVVVIGYGSVKRSDLTSSVSKITDKAITDRPIVTMSEALQGQLAGVQAQATSGGVPGQEMTIRVRGFNTINGDSSPLYVIDGVPRDGMSDLNPSDISSIQVLKDASATSIYGARGGNGVILIETKKGAGKPTVTFDAYYGFQNAEKKLDLMDGKEYIAYTMYFRNVQYLRAGGSMSTLASSRPSGYVIPDAWSTRNDFVYWDQEVLRTAPIQSYQASASAKGDIGSIYFSLGYMDQAGIVRYTDFNKFNTRLNASMNIGKHMRVGINLAAQQSDQELSGSDSGYAKETSIHHSLMISPLMKLTEGTRDWGQPADDVIGGGSYPNPVEQLKYTKDDEKWTRIAASLWGEYDIMKGLTFRTQYSRNYDGRTYEYFQPGNVSYNTGYQTRGNSHSSTLNEWTFQNTLTYDNTFLNVHHVNVVVGQSALKQNYYYINAAASGWPYENIETLNKATTPTAASTLRSEYTNASFFGRLSYDYMDKYLFTASVRRDGSSRFGSNSRWGVFPAFSAGWKINEESFMKNIKQINLLKIRGSWGTSGNDRIGNYVYSALLGSYNTSWNGALVAGAAPSNVANNDLKWEATTSVDLGLDISAFDNRIQLNFDWYNNTTKDLLYEVPIPYTSGFSSNWTNLGKVRNRGFEIDLTTHNLVGDFKWDTNLNLAHNKNKILDMGADKQFIVGDYEARFITQVGHSISRFYCYRSNGFLKPTDFDANGKALVPIIAGQEVGNRKYVDTNKDGIINTSDYQPYGNNLPDVTFGFTNHFSYKGIELSVMLQGQVGGKIYFLGSRHMDTGVAGGRRLYSRWLRCYKPDYASLYGRGDPIPTDYITKNNIDMSWDGKTPSPWGQSNLNDDSRVYNASYLRIKNITLSYVLPKLLLRKTILSSAKFYVSPDNVKTFDSYVGYTPESNRFGSTTTELGVDYSTYPLSRRCTFGVNLVF
jgi:TonB-linked SusC/RagA family outer membrane protein